MDLNILEKSRPFSDKKIFEKTESVNSANKNSSLSILSEVNQRILSTVQQSAATLGFITLEEMSERAANVKKYAKSKPGNVYLKDRRPPLGAMPKK